MKERVGEYMISSIGLVRDTDGATWYDAEDVNGTSIAAMFVNGRYEVSVLGPNERRNYIGEEAKAVFEELESLYLRCRRETK